MRQFIMAAILLAAASTSALAGNGQGGNNNNQGGGSYHGTPGPLIGAGPVGLVIGVGYGLYWLVRRRRKAS
jgi:hypothetical protein